MTFGSGVRLDHRKSSVCRHFFFGCETNTLIMKSDIRFLLKYFETIT